MIVYGILGIRLSVPATLAVLMIWRRLTKVCFGLSWIGDRLWGCLEWKSMGEIMLTEVTVYGVDT